MPLSYLLPTDLLSSWIIIRCPLSVHLLPSPLSNPTVSLSFLLYPFSSLDDTISRYFSLLLDLYHRHAQSRVWFCSFWDHTRRVWISTGGCIDFIRGSGLLSQGTSALIHFLMHFFIPALNPFLGSYYAVYYTLPYTNPPLYTSYLIHYIIYLYIICPSLCTPSFHHFHTFFPRYIPTSFHAFLHNFVSLWYLFSYDIFFLFERVCYWKRNYPKIS